MTKRCDLREQATLANFEVRNPDLDVLSSDNGPFTTYGSIYHKNRVKYHT